MKKRIFAGILMLCAAAVVFLILEYTGLIRMNHPVEPVRGVDVSHYQGRVDFSMLAEQGIQFAFIKATEGASHVDECFARNLAGVQDSGMRYGFYHFFSYDSPGSAQAENFIAHVPKMDGMLPPVIDVEFYGEYTRWPPGRDQVLPELRAMIDALESFYGVKPILYCTNRSWRLYVQDTFEDCDLWIRSVYFSPRVDQKWKFWQYTDRGVLNGYDGEEKYIDMNVFSGTQQEFDAYGIS